jgi:hypothetical protein
MQKVRGLICLWCLSLLFVVGCERIKRGEVAVQPAEVVKAPKPRVKPEEAKPPQPEVAQQPTAPETAAPETAAPETAAPQPTPPEATQPATAQPTPTKPLQPSQLLNQLHLNLHLSRKLPNLQRRQPPKLQRSILPMKREAFGRVLMPSTANLTAYL